MIIDLSHSMQDRVAEWQRLGHKVDTTLLFECAYYPRGGCQSCSFNQPNQDCRWSHILIDTRINPSNPSIQPTKHRNKTGKRVINLDVFLSRLPGEVREEIRKIVEGR